MFINERTDHMKNTRHHINILLCALVCFCMIIATACSDNDNTAGETADNDTAVSETVQEDSGEAPVADEESADTEEAEPVATETEEKAETETKKEEKKKDDKKSDKKKAESKKDSKKKPEKKWVEPVYKEVYHEEEGHYETQNTGRIKCCGRRSGKDGCPVYFSSMDAYKSHQQAYVEKKRKELNDPDYECQGDHAPAKYETEEVWVVDSPAWTEKVLVKEGHWE